MMTPFVILAAPRTGSNLLCTLLNSHPDILCHHELFNPRGIFTARDFQEPAIQQTKLEDRDHAPLEFLSRVWSFGRGNRCVGFKWTRGQDERILAHVLGTREIKKIILRRRNRVKTFVSELVALRTDQWEVYDRRELVSRPQVTVDAAALRKHIAQNEALYTRLLRVLRQSRQDYLELAYESLLSSRAHSRLLGFLDALLPDCRLIPDSVKQNATDLRHAIANYEELAAQLAGSELAGELRDTGL